MNYEDKYRCTGRSLRRALRYITEALQHPGKAIDIRDHYDTLDSHTTLLHWCQDLVKKLELEGFTFNKSSLTMVCNYRPESKLLK